MTCVTVVLESRTLRDGGGRWSRTDPRSSGTVTVWPLDLKPSTPLSVSLSLPIHTHTHTHFQTCKLGQRKAGTWPSYLHFNKYTHTHTHTLPTYYFIPGCSSGSLVQARTQTVLPSTRLNAFVFWKLPWQNLRGWWDTMLMIFFRHGNPSHMDTDAAHSLVLVFLFCEPRAKIKQQQQQQEKDNVSKLFHNPAAL